MGQPGDAAGPGVGDEFDAIRARVDRLRREALERIEALRDPTGLDVRLPPRPGTRPPAVPDRPLPPAPVSPPAAEVPPAEVALAEVPPAEVAPDVAPPAAEVAPAVAAPSDWRDRAALSEAVPPPLPTERVIPPLPSVAARPPRPVPVPPVVVTAVPVPPSDQVGRVIPTAELPPPGAGWAFGEDDLSDLDDGAVTRADPQGSGAALSPLTALRELVERIAISRSILVTVWQLASVLLLVAVVAWLVWFPLASGSGGSQALVAVDDRMAPVVQRGDVVLVSPSPDLPYPLDSVVALDVSGTLVIERIVDERTEDERRVLITRADAVSFGPSREVLPEDVAGAVRRVTRGLGYPALWFASDAPVWWRLLGIAVLLVSLLGAVSLLVRNELRRQDRRLVSAIASGDRSLPRR